MDFLNYREKHMALLIFNNGTASSAALNNTKSSYFSANSSLKQIDFANSSESKDLYSNDKPQQQSINQKNPVVASPSQKLSYINTGKTTDSLENRRRLKASHVMTSPVLTAMPHDLVDSAKLLMQENKVSHLVVVDANNTPLGLIKSKDLLAVSSPESVFIQSILNTSLLAVLEDTLVRDIALTFMEYKATAISVVNNNHQLTGIISRSDLLSLLVSSPNQKVKA
ncbi:MAG: CBS domain-containing protein [Oceanospirillaceae bacterium]|jgi:CBS domain-containing protein